MRGQRERLFDGLDFRFVEEAVSPCGMSADVGGVRFPAGREGARGLWEDQSRLRRRDRGTDEQQRRDIMQSSMTRGSPRELLLGER